MLKISDAVRDILMGTDTELEAMRMGLLNLSAYAEKIVPQVEKRTLKPVKKETIVVTLSRLAKDLQQVPPLLPHVSIEDFKVISPLLDVTYEKTQANVQAAAKIPEIASRNPNGVAVVTQGVGEITIIASQELADAIGALFYSKPLAVFPNLVGISVGFSQDLLQTPNAIYAILTAIAKERINLIEIISTYTQLMVVVKDEDMERTITALKKFFPSYMR